MYIKKGTMIENQLDLLYSLARNKLDSDYIDKLSQILYECKTIKNYPLKRINLEKTIYSYNKNNELYITLPNFYYKNKSMTSDNKINNNKKNNSIQNSTENGSNFLTTNDTNYNSSNIQLSEINKKKLNIFDIYGNKDEEKLNRSIKKLLLDDKKELTGDTCKLFFNQLNKKYNFENSNKKKKFLTKSKLRLKKNTKVLKNNLNLIFPKISNDKFYDYLNVLKRKTYELDKLKSNRYKNDDTPIIFLGRNNSKYYSELKNSYLKLNKDKIMNDKIRSVENKKFIKLMENDVNSLLKINKENKYILESKNI